MSNPEQPSASQGPNVPLGSRFLNRIRRSRGPAEPKTETPSTPENQYFDIHRDRVAKQVLSFFDAVDARVGAWIGYSGNIREEIKGRAVGRSSYHHDLNVQGLDPSLQRYVQHNIFFFRLDNEKDGSTANYKINCQAGAFIPSVYMETHDGSIVATLRLGPNNNEFERVNIRRVFNDGRVREVSTFVANYMDSFSPPHPLVLEGGEGAHFIYDTIDAAGNVTLLDGQLMYAPGGAVGRYSSEGHTISPVRGGPFPYGQTTSHLLIGDPGDHQIPIPLQTNIYDELRDITAGVRAIGSQ